MKAIAIIGAGPAGMLAAHACVRNGYVPVIYSNTKQPSVIQPDMFLQRAIPGLHEDAAADAMLRYVPRGDAGTYRRKVYGTDRGPTSWSSVHWGQQPLWWLAGAYAHLWSWYSAAMVDLEVTRHSVDMIVDAFPLVISAMPSETLCQRPEVHTFEKQVVFYVKRPARKPVDPGLNVMIYNGTDDTPWHKYTRLAGLETWEYRTENRDHHSVDASYYVGVKAVSNNCDCHPDLHRVGRWAQWQHGVLNHHAFEQTNSILASAGLAKED